MKQKSKYQFRRLYVNCIDDKEKTSSRGYIRRKHRIIIPILVFILLASLNVVFIINDTDHYIVFLMVSAIMLLCIMWITKTGAISLLNILNLHLIRKKKNKNIFDQFFLYINKEGNLIPINDRHLRSIKENPIFWTKLKLVFSDSLNNEYLILISSKKIRLKVKCEHKNTVKLGQTKSRIRTFANKDLNNIYSVEVFIEFIRNIIREAMSNVNT